MRMKTLALGIVLGLAAVSLAAAQEPVCQVNGTVLGKDRKGLPGLTVAAIMETGGVIYGTSTYEDGHYALKGLKAGSYSVVVVLPGNLVSRKDAIRLRPLFRSIVDFNLTSDAPGSSLPAITPVAAPPPDAEQAAGGRAEASISVTCALSGTDRAPTPDATLVLTPVEGAGRRRQGRTDSAGMCVVSDVPPGDYHMSVRAPGFITWSLGPAAMKEPGSLKVTLLLVPFPMNFEGTLEDKLVPADPIPPATP